MAKGKAPRTGFLEWVDKNGGVASQTLPLTHITKGLVAHDIIKAGRIEPSDCKVFKSPLAYFFYGRPAYRFSAGSSIKLEASCPFCFLFDGKLLGRAKTIFPFDTGAFEARMYNHVLDEEFKIEDFNLGADPSRPEKLISAAYLNRAAYLAGNRDEIKDPNSVAKPYELEARAYLNLIKSPGRNEPDDRIGSIEVQFGDPIPLAGSLLAVIAPHTHWVNGDRSPLLEKVQAEGAEVLTYAFIPGRPMEHYHTLVELAVRDYCRTNGLI